MQYRPFGKLNWKVSALGFGAMRLPIIGSNQANVDEAQATKLIRYAIDQGVNYIDTAYPYHDGNSEVAVGKALQGEYRRKAKVATKMPVFSVQKREDLDTIFNLQLRRLQADSVDFYLMHALMGSTWSKVEELNMLDWAERQMAEGRIGYLGFSFHDEVELFKEIVDAYSWSFCQIQYNYLDEHYQAGKEGLRYAADRGLAVVVMEPLAGGLLAVKPPVEIQQVWQKAAVARSPPELALQWVWNQPQVAMALSGMNSLEQVQENLAVAENAKTNMLSQRELALYTQARVLYQKLGYIGCSKCRYCSQCPQSIDIPAAFEYLNQHAANRRSPQMQDKIKQQYQAQVPPEHRASRCLHCAQCESLCPQHLPVRKLLCEAAASLE